MLAGPAFPVYRHYDFSHSRDTLTYLHVARGEYAGESVTRRYRVVVPWLAAALTTPARLGAEHGRLKDPLRPPPTRDTALPLAFFVVNTLLLAVAGAIVWRTAEAAGAARLAAGLGMAIALSSRWATYAAALPLTDSLYCLVFALALYGVVARARWALLACALFGPLAKESFVFLLPWLLWFGRPPTGSLRAWGPLLVALAGGYGAVALVHAYVDARAGAPATASVANAFAHFDNIPYALRRLLSVHGAAEIFSIFGFSWLVLAAGPVRGTAGWWARLGAPAQWLPAVAAVHMLLSGDLGRMGYLAFPTFGVAVALALSHLASAVRADPQP